MSSGELAGLKYVQRWCRCDEPKDSSSAILLCLLHGTGADEHDLICFGEELGDFITQKAGRSVCVVSLRAPMKNQLGPGFKWFSGFSPWPEPEALTHDIPNAVEKLNSFFRAAPEKFNICSKHSFLLGFSQGATVGWSMAATCAIDIKYILLSGRLMPEHDNFQTVLGKSTASLKRLLIDEYNRLKENQNDDEDDDQLCECTILQCHGKFDEITNFQMAKDSNFQAWRIFAETKKTIDFMPSMNCGHTIDATMVSNVQDFLLEWCGARAKRGRNLFRIDDDHC